MAGGFAAQCEKTFANIEKVMKAAGGDLSNIVKLTIYMTHIMRDQGELNDITWKLFGREMMPPRTIVEIPMLAHEDMLIGGR